MNSTVHFNRWGHVQWQTRPFQVFKQYNNELSEFLWAEYAAHEYVKTNLINTISPNDDCSKHLRFPNKVWNFQKMRDWSRAFDEGQNYLYLNCVVALSSNLEVFLKSIITLAVESNPGVLTGAPRTIDGVRNLKYNRPVTGYRRRVKDCVDGQWPERIAAIDALFGSHPTELDTYLADLEAIRELRNKVGHAFGRDIKAACGFSDTEKLPIERLSSENLRSWLKITYDVATAMDQFLLNYFIGEYQAIYEYHKNKDKWKYEFSDVKARNFKALYGKIDQQIGLEFCEELVEYYEKL